MDSIRERVIQELKYVAEQLTIDEGFHSDCGENVKRGRKNWDETDAPCMSIFPGIEESSLTTYGYDLHAMPVQFDVLETYDDLVATYGDEAASVMGERILADIKEVIKRSRSALLSGDPALIKSIKYTGGGIQDYPELSKKTIGVTATFEITYETKKGDPYNQ